MLMAFQHWYPLHNDIPDLRKSSLSSLLNSPVLIAVGVSAFAITSLFILDLETIGFAIVALLATFAVLATLHQLTRDEIDESSSVRVEIVFEYLAWPTVFCLVVAFALQILIFGLVDLSITTIVPRGIVKAVFWTSLYIIVSFEKHSV
jgi:hypothetical protein